MPILLACSKSHVPMCLVSATCARVAGVLHSLRWQVILAAVLLVYQGPCTMRPGYSDEPAQPQFTNELIHSTSPYLLQHAHNPVNWLPWGPEAFAKAKLENKPIFVSIGYSTCFWCHVMERESFEDEQVAAVLNAHYVAIKVDREQRPDIDEQLMLATQLLTGRGGWPNSVWLTPDGRPWMAGTYFPKASFMEALSKLATVWTEQPEAVDKQANSFADAIREASRVAPVSVVSSAGTPIERAMDEARQLYDADFAGFGSKPKFPPHGLLRLLAFEARENQSQAALDMLTQTLDAMWAGGIHDHVGGGFHRYATDEKWFLPHFEKMLYDNAQLMRSYAEAYEITHDELYRQAVADIATWLEREMTHEQGGFYSAIDSESDGREGGYYTWSQAELESLLTADAAKRFSQAYHISAEGNYTEEASGERTGTNILYLDFDRNGMRMQAADSGLTEVRKQLLAARTSREYPHLDDKILTSWNGLTISSLAFAGRVLDNPQYTRMATRAAEFVLAELVREDSLLRSWRAGRAELPGYLEDYAFLNEGLLELFRTTHEQRWLDAAQQLTTDMLKQFEDSQHGGFYFTGPKHETLIVRSKNLNGGGNLPVANGVAACVLLELDQLTKQPQYRPALERTLQGLSGVMVQAPRQVEHLVLADAIFRLRKSRSADQTSLPADASYASEAVKAEVFTSHQQVAAGQRIQLAIVLDITPGYHLYAEAPATTQLALATSIKLRPATGCAADELQQPAGERSFDPLLQCEISRYSGRNIFILPITIAANAQRGKLPLEIELRYQACDATRCLQPQTAVLPLQILVAEQPGPRRHGELIP